LNTPLHIVSIFRLLPKLEGWRRWGKSIEASGRVDAQALQSASMKMEKMSVSLAWS
jgi:hypothetical protein